MKDKFNKKNFLPYENVFDGDELWRIRHKFRYNAEKKDWFIVVQDRWELMNLDFPDTEHLMFPFILEEPENPWFDENGNRIIFEEENEN